MSEEKPSAPKVAKESSDKPATSGIQNGKGDAPRNITEKFRSNYDDINWSNRAPRVEGSKVRKVY